MARPIIDPNFQLVNSAGAPISGAVYTFFISGGSTPQNVYDSPLISTPVGTSLTTNSLGRVSAAYADPRVSYKVTLTIPSGPTITTDPWITDEANGQPMAPENGWYLEAADRMSLHINNVEVVESDTTEWEHKQIFRMVDKQHRLDYHGDIASGASTDLSTLAGNSARVTGTTTITSFGSVDAGTIVTLRFESALSITHNATSMICPGATDITTSAGSVLEVLSLGGGNWQIINIRQRWVTFTSTNQTITAGGLLTLAHSLPSTPLPGDVSLELVCAVNDSGWIAGDVTPIAHGANATNRGTGVYTDSTNVYVRVGSDANSISHIRKDTGASFNITNASWTLRVRARVIVQ